MAQVKVFSLGGIGHPCCCAPQDNFVCGDDSLPKTDLTLTWTCASPVPGNPCFVCGVPPTSGSTTLVWDGATQWVASPLLPLCGQWHTPSGFVCYTLLYVNFGCIADLLILSFAGSALGSPDFGICSLGQADATSWSTSPVLMTWDISAGGPCFGGPTGIGDPGNLSGVGYRTFTLSS